MHLTNQVVLVLMLPRMLLGSDCEICDLKDELLKTNQELSACQTLLKDNTGGTLGQVCSTVGSWFSKDNSLKKVAESLLEKMEVLNVPDQPTGIEREFTLTLTPSDLRTLKEFVLLETGNNEKVEKILIKSIRVHETMLDKTSDFISSTLSETSMHFKANYVIIFQVLVLLCCVILPLALGAPKIPVILFMCLYSVFTTWVKLYYTAAAKKQAILAKHAHVPSSCYIEKQGYLAALTDFVSGLFNGRQDPCEDYYTAVMVDPALEVGLVTALMETLSSCLVIPAQSLGLALGQYYTSVLQPLPWVWKLPVMILATLIILFMLLMTCGYEFSIPLFCRIGPDSRRRRKSDGSGSISGVHQFEELPSTNRSDNQVTGGWRQSLVYEKHPSEEYDSTDNSKKTLPYPAEKNQIDKIVDGC